MSRARAALAIAMLLVPAARVTAQTYRTPSVPRPGTLEAAIGASRIGGIDFGERRAQELRNPSTGTDPLVLFVTTSRLDPAAGVQARFGVYLFRRVVVEAGARYSKPLVVTRITSDFESAPDTVARETLSQYVFDGSVLFHVAEFSGGRVVPFVQGGAGHIRDLHQRGELVQTGSEYHGGGGIKVWFGRSTHRLGIRGDLAASSRTRGFDFRTGRRTIPTFGASLIFRF